MKTITLKKDSWHRRLAVGMNWSPWRHGDDFCLYARRVFFGCILVVMLSCVAMIIGAVYLWITLNFLWWAVGSLLDLSFLPLWDAATPGLVVNSVILALAVSHGMIHGWISMRWTTWPFQQLARIPIPTCAQIPMCEDTKNFLVNGWGSIRDKVCFRMKFTDNQGKEEQEIDWN